MTLHKTYLGTEGGVPLGNLPQTQHSQPLSSPSKVATPYWISKQGHGGPTISPAQSKRLAELDLELFFDFYGPFDESEDAGLEEAR